MNANIRETRGVGFNEIILKVQCVCLCVSHPVGAGEGVHPAGSDAEERRRLDLGALRVAGQGRSRRRPAACHRVHQPGAQVSTVTTTPYLLISTYT